MRAAWKDTEELMEERLGIDYGERENRHGAGATVKVTSSGV
jgi:hypothetical protein